MDDIAIKVDQVSKNFVLPHERVNSIKSLFTGLAKGKHNTASETQHALKDISFEIKKGEFFGIVGRNGSGKSTLLKILAGIYQPTAGQVSTHGKLVPFIELGVGFNAELTGRENVFLNGAMLGFSRKEIEAMYDDVVAFAELEKFMDQKLKNYSSGMQVRLAFSMATRAKADILLVDEVLAVGDADFQRKCFDYFLQLKKNKKTVVFVTHDMNAVREYCQRAIMIEKSKIIAAGSASEIASRYTRLFMDGPKNDKKGPDLTTRWGDEAIKYEAISLSSEKLIKDTDIKIRLTARASKTVEHPIFGFLIKNTAHSHILGTNTQIKRQEIDRLKAGESIEIEWVVPNIFNDGTYYIDPAIIYKGGSQVADWWEQAAHFSVLKEDKTPYIVNPEVSLNYSQNKE
jgi:ABC-2 type transport system ATP-binding protein